MLAGSGQLRGAQQQPAGEQRDADEDPAGPRDLRLVGPGVQAGRKALGGCGEGACAFGGGGGVGWGLLWGDAWGVNLGKVRALVSILRVDLFLLQRVGTN